MHELSIAQNLQHIIQENIPSTEKIEIKSIKIKAGLLSGLDKECFSFSWQTISKDTIFENTNIDIQIQPLKIYCHDCKKEYEINERFAIFCPAEPKHNIKVISDASIILESYEYDKLNN